MSIDGLGVGPQLDWNITVKPYRIGMSKLTTADHKLALISNNNRGEEFTAFREEINVSDWNPMLFVSFSISVVT